MALFNKTKQTKTKSAPRGKGYNSLLIILVSLILLAIPISIIGKVVYESYMESGVPILGERLEGKIATKITDEQINQIDTALAALPVIEKSESNLQAATLKFGIDLKDDVKPEQIEEIKNQVYQEVIKVLPVETYFSQNGQVRNYDLEVTFFNNPESLDFMAVLIKNSMMAEPKLNILSTPLDAETAQKALQTIEPAQPEQPQTEQPVTPETPAPVTP